MVIQVYPSMFFKIYTQTPPPPPFTRLQRLQVFKRHLKIAYDPLTINYEMYIHSFQFHPFLFTRDINTSQMPGTYLSLCLGYSGSLTFLFTWLFMYTHFLYTWDISITSDIQVYPLPLYWVYPFLYFYLGYPGTSLSLYLGYPGTILYLYLMP